MFGVFARSCGADSRPGKVDTVAFAGATRSEGAPKPGSASDADSTGAEIRRVLDDWYQRAFADPSQYGDGSFPEVAKHFGAEAGIGFVEDRSALTIGALADDVRQVSVKTQVANIVVYFDEGKPSYATVSVRFGADIQRKDRSRVDLFQRASLVMERRDGEWKIVNYYDARQTVDSVPSEATPSP